jgi:PST family polysaccharide transporter
MAAIPYILHRIGPENFGIISVAYSSIMIFKVLVDYGFDISGVRLISRLQGDQQKTNNVFSNVFYIRFTIIILLGILLLLSTFFISAVDEHFSIYISTFLMLPGFVLQAIWVYTGAEKTKFIYIINLSMGLCYILGLLAFVKNENDYIYVPLIQSLAIISSGILSQIILIRKLNIRFTKLDIHSIYLQFKEGYPTFFANLGINLYRNSSVIILSFFVPKEVTGLYAAAERVIKALQNLLSPLTNALFPMLSRISSEDQNRGQKLILNAALGLFLLAFFLVILIQMFGEIPLLYFFGHEFAQSILYFDILIIVLPFGIANYVLGVIYMLNNRLEITFMLAVLIVGILAIAFYALVSKYYEAIGTSFVYLGAEILLVLIFASAIYRSRLLK